MRKTYLTVFIAMLLVMLVDRAISQIIFYADFEPDSSEAIPDDSVNDPANYVPENAGTVWTLSDEFPGGGTALHQTAEGCDISGNTPLPGVDWFSDGLIQAVFSWQDDDSVGFQFRREGDDSGYLVSFGYNETPKLSLGISQMDVVPLGNVSTNAGAKTVRMNSSVWITVLAQISRKTTVSPISPVLKSLGAISGSGI